MLSLCAIKMASRREAKAGDKYFINVVKRWPAVVVAAARTC